MRSRRARGAFGEKWTISKEKLTKENDRKKSEGLFLKIINIVYLLLNIVTCLQSTK